MRAVLLFLAILFCAAPALAQPWRITHDHWTAQDEAGFGAFVAAIGNSDCSSSESCLRDPANPYRGSDKRFLDIDVDCAKLPYLLRAYYAWKNGLPFSYVDAVSGEGGDLRFTKTANRAVGRHDIIDHSGGIDAPRAIREMLDSVFSATYRTDARETRGVLSDFYSPALAPGSIHAGSVVYDINGHVGIVYKVDEDGRIYYMDAHPDFTLSRSVYGAQFGQSPMRLGGGLKNWRPFTLVHAHRTAQGLVGGHMAFAENSDIPDFSLVQYTGTEEGGGKPRFVYDGTPLGFYEYIRVAVSGGKMTYNPVYELQATMKTLCNDLNDRAQYVNLAISDGMAVREHPARLPDNIYGSDNTEWENYGTPSRDARIKAGFVQFHHDLNEMITLWVNRDERIVYDGNDLKADLAAAYEAQSKACTITYLSSDKHPVAMSFDDMVHRLFAMSFDPYMCVELRWGDVADSCPDGREKKRWYAAEQRLCNQPDRTYDIAMGFDLSELRAHAKGSGIDTPPVIDIKALIDAMPPRVPFRQYYPGD
ncbi:MAG TPA: hypothetical protein VIJ72_00240 [Rhizomicrobium sp.]